MRSDEIIIGGKPYPVQGLSVRQSLAHDSLRMESKDPVDVRMRLIAIALQNGGAYLPERTQPAPIDGQPSTKVVLFKTSDKTTEEVIDALDGDIFDNMEEWYAAELVVMKLNHKLPDQPKTGTSNEEPHGDQVAGEALATA